jgi:uncharacterized protein (TIGR02246 family)
MRAGIRAAAVALIIPMATLAHAADPSPIEVAQASWEKAFSGGDGAAAAAAVFTEDARLLPPGEPMVEGRAAVGKYWQGAFDAGVKDLELGLIAVDMVGDDTMIETGTWAITVPGSDGGRQALGGKALVIWKKGSDGVWRMAQDMWSANE